MTFVFAAKLGLSIWTTDINTQKIDNSALRIYGMLIAGFSNQNKTGKVWYFEETFWLTDISMKIVLKISFLDLKNAYIQFDTKSFTWKSYNIAKVLPIARQVKLINKYKFGKAALYENSETFIVHITALKTLKPIIYFS